MFQHFLCEDRSSASDSNFSYVDFLCHMHKEIRAILNWKLKACKLILYHCILCILTKSIYFMLFVKMKVKMWTICHIHIDCFRWIFIKRDMEVLKCWICFTSASKLFIVKCFPIRKCYFATCDSVMLWPSDTALYSPVSMMGQVNHLNIVWRFELFTGVC